MSNFLQTFAEEFKESKYKVISPQYTGDDKKEYQNSKRPVNDKLYWYDVDCLIELNEDGSQTTTKVKLGDKYRLGWLVPKEYIVVDVDNMLNSKVVFEILQKNNVKFSYMMSKHGGHFIFKNLRGIKSISAGKLCALGFTVDIRANEKGYIILPENDTDRKWGNISNKLDDIPSYLSPLSSLKTSEDFLNIKEGEGRNSKLFAHYMNLKDYAPELNEEEKIESIKIINSFLFKQPLDEDELNKTVLRKENIEKQSSTVSSEDEEINKLEKIAQKIINEYKIITVNDDCYLYTGKYYRQLLDLKEIERIIHINYSKNLKANQRAEIISFIKLKSWVNTDEVNKNWNEVVFNNGIYNIYENKLYPHSPSKYNTIYIDYDYNSEVTYSPTIDNFFNDVTNRDENKKHLLYEIIGYTMLRKNIFNKFFIFFGEGATGKSTYLKLILKMIGQRNSAFISLSDLEKPFVPANLYNKLVNLGDDIPYKGLSETDILKKLVTGEYFAAAQKYKQEMLNFSSFAKLLFTTNKLPQIADRSSGFARRICLISLNHKITQPNPFFLDLITIQDMEYMIVNALKYVREALMRNSLTELDESNEFLEDYLIDQSTFLSYVKDEGITPEFLDGKTVKEIYLQFVEYCKESGRKGILGRNTFNAELENNLKVRRRNTTYKGDGKQTWRWMAK